MKSITICHIQIESGFCSITIFVPNAFLALTVMMLFSAVPFILATGNTYLDFDNLPETNFSCDGKVIGGYYADIETGCQMFHVCTVGLKAEVADIKFLCLNGTIFDQQTRVCERIDEVDCSKSEQLFSLNLELYNNMNDATAVRPIQSEDDDEDTEKLNSCDKGLSCEEPTFVYNNEDDLYSKSVSLTTNVPIITKQDQEAPFLFQKPQFSKKQYYPLQVTSTVPTSTDLSNPVSQILVLHTNFQKNINKLNVSKQQSPGNAANLENTTTIAAAAGINVSATSFIMDQQQTKYPISFQQQLINTRKNPIISSSSFLHSYSSPTSHDDSFHFNLKNSPTFVHSNHRRYIPPPPQLAPLPLNHNYSNDNEPTSDAADMLYQFDSQKIKNKSEPIVFFQPYNYDSVL